MEKTLLKLKQLAEEQHVGMTFLESWLDSFLGEAELPDRANLRSLCLDPDRG